MMDLEKRDKRRQHLFPECARYTNRQVSHRVATEFCRAYTRQFGMAAQLVEVEKDGVDAIIRVGDVEVALELVSYRQRDEHHEVEPADTKVREEVSATLVKCGLPQLDVWIWWAKEPRRNRGAAGTAMRTKVPSRQELEPFATEFATLATFAKNNGLYDTRIGFCSNPEDRNRRTPSGCNYVDMDLFPRLSKYCSFVRLTPTVHSGRPSLRTSVDTRAVGLDEEGLKCVVRDKLAKVARYRAGVGSKPLWLAIHCDSYPLSTRLPLEHRPQALNVIRREVCGVPRPFDKVWWAENTALVDAVTLHEVQCE